MRILLLLTMLLLTACAQKPATEAAVPAKTEILPAEAETASAEAEEPAGRGTRQQTAPVRTGTSAERPEDYQVFLEQGTVTVTQGGAELWHTPQEYDVERLIRCDIDRDGRDELVLLLWKYGRYGKSRPFWEDETAGNDEYDQHIFIYRVTDGEVHAVWCSSDLGMEIRALEYLPQQGILVTETDGRQSLWDWKSWGLEFVASGDSMGNPAGSQGGEQTEKTPGEVRFLAVGDLLMHLAVCRDSLEHTGSFDNLFEHLQERIAAADLASVGQETMLVEDPALYGDYPLFGTPLGVGKAVRDAGFDIAAGAVNHALDRGVTGIRTTTAFYRSAGILCPGLQSPEEECYEPYLLTEKNGVRIALLGYTFGTNGQRLPESCPYLVHTFGDEARVREDLRLAAEAADAVIVFAHWGTEYAAAPDDFQEKWARIFLEEGVDVVIGTHPHVVQRAEYLTRPDGRRMLVYYSLGNYIASQKDPACNVGGLAAFTLRRRAAADGCEITEASLEPLIIHRAGGHYTVYPMEEYPEVLCAVSDLKPDIRTLSEAFPGLCAQ